MTTDSTTTVDDATLFLGEAWSDPIEAGIRDRIRGFIEELIEEELAAALGRVYFELEMLYEATEQFEKLEMRAPDMPVVHAFLGAVFERSGEARAAFDEYRRALRLGHAFDWPHRCHVCSATAPTLKQAK